METPLGIQDNYYLFAEIEPIKNNYSDKYGIKKMFTKDEIDDSTFGLFPGAKEYLTDKVRYLSNDRGSLNAINYAEVITLDKTLFSPFRSKLYHIHKNSNDYFTHFFDVFTEQVDLKKSYKIKNEKNLIAALADGWDLCFDTNTSMRILEKSFIISFLCIKLFSAKYDLQMVFENQEVFLKGNKIKGTRLRRNIELNGNELSVNHNVEISNPLYRMTNGNLKTVSLYSDVKQDWNKLEQSMILRKSNADNILKKEADDYKEQKLQYEIKEIKEEIKKKKDEMNKEIQSKKEKQQKLKEKIEKDIEKLNKDIEFRKEVNDNSQLFAETRKDIEDLDSKIKEYHEDFIDSLETIRSEFLNRTKRVIKAQKSRIDQEISYISNNVMSKRAEAEEELTNNRNALNAAIKKKDDAIVKKITSTKKEIDKNIVSFEEQANTRETEFKKARAIFEHQIEQLDIRRNLEESEKIINKAKDEQYEFLNDMQKRLNELYVREMTRINTIISNTLKAPGEIVKGTFTEPDNGTKDPFEDIL